MRRNLAEVDVNVSGETESNSYTIKTSGKAFRALIDGIYSNKIQSVIRELWTNAYDSHVKAGKKYVPFEVTLPTSFDMTFKVRDFGTSLSHEEVMILYTTMFESSKEDSTDEVGHIGLGSKSPFCYTDTFTVTAYLDGVMRVYSAYIGKDSVPKISFFGESPTEEENGFSVEFAVNDNDDIHEFNREAQRVALGFDVLPKVIIGLINEFEVPTPDKEIELEGGYSCKLYFNDYGDSNSVKEAYAKQGTVLYPIDLNSVKKLDRELKTLLRSGVIVEFPLDSLDIAISRESLGYDDETCQNIVNHLSKIKQPLIDFYCKDVTEADTLWEASCRLKEIDGRLDIDYELKNFIKQTVTWRGKKVHTVCRFGYNLRDSKLSFSVGISIYNYSQIRDTDLRWKEKSIPGLEIIRDNNTKIIVQDTNTKYVRTNLRIKQYMMNNHDKDKLIWIKIDTSSYLFKRLLVKLGRPPILFLEDLPEAVIDSSVYVRKKVMCKQFDRNNRSFVDTEIDVDQEGIYIPLLRTVPQLGLNEYMDKQLSVYAFSTIYDNAIDLGIISEDDIIYGIPKTNMSVTEDNDKWVNFFHIVDEFQKKFFHKFLYEKAKQRTKFLEYNNKFNQFFLKYSSIANGIKQDNDIKRSFKWFDSMLNKELDEAGLRDLGGIVLTMYKRNYARPIGRNEVFPDRNNLFYIPKFCLSCINKYPLIQHVIAIASNSRENDYDEFYAENYQEYINNIDAKESLT